MLPPPVMIPLLTRTFRTIPVMRGDVILHANPTASYVPAREVFLQFDMHGQRVLGVHVSIGDVVTRGQVIAELDRPYIQGQLEAALREEEWAMLDLAHLEARHALALLEVSITNRPIDDTSFRNERAAIYTRLTNIRARISYLQRQDYYRYLRTPIDGVITSVMPFQEGMFSDERIVATVTDQSRSVFRVRTEEARMMNPGDVFTLYVNRDPFLAEVVCPDYFGIYRTHLWDVEAYMVVVGEQPVIGAITFATVHIVLETSTDTLFIPIITLNQTRDRTFVFVYGTEGREIRDVVIGLVGNTMVEIISGLEEGELVIVG